MHPAFVWRSSLKRLIDRTRLKKKGERQSEIETPIKACLLVLGALLSEPKPRVQMCHLSLGNGPGSGITGALRLRGAPGLFPPLRVVLIVSFSLRFLMQMHHHAGNLFNDVCFFYILIKSHGVNSHEFIAPGLYQSHKSHFKARPEYERPLMSTTS